MKGLATAMLLALLLCVSFSASYDTKLSLELATMSQISFASLS
jgi:hypothetical protein